MNSLQLVSNSYEDTLALGARLAKVFKSGDMVCLFGDLGAGKTALVKGMARGLGMDPKIVHSPTFTLMNIYDGKLPVYHFDMYRIQAEDLFAIGYEEFFYGKGIAVVEWSERLEGLLPVDYWKVELQHSGEDKRQIVISCGGVLFQARFNKFKDSF